MTHKAGGILAILFSFVSLFILSFIPPRLSAQIDTIVIPAGTPEDNDLNAIANQQDAQKKVSMYQDFLQKYASNQPAVAYANWQLSQSYQSTGDLQKALECGDKAVAASPHNLDILTSQVTIAQQLKDNARIFRYSIQGGEAFNSIEKQPKPADMSDEQFASTVASQKDANKNAYEFFEGAAFNGIAGENDAKSRMDYIEKFTVTFPKSKMDEQVTSYAMLSLSQLQDKPRLVAYAEKALAANPNNLPALLLLANNYVDSSEPGALAKAVTYAQKAIVAAKADDPAAEKSQKIAAGVAHSVMGRSYAKQSKTLPSISELKSATALLKGNDEQQYAVAAYYLGWDYAKLNKLTEARAVLNEAAGIPGPVQQPVKDLLTKVNTARAAGK
ncbi:MAG: tetratricopeptide repeat protein [Terriglobales bacterium]